MGDAPCLRHPQGCVGLAGTRASRRLRPPTAPPRTFPRPLGYARLTVERDAVRYASHADTNAISHEVIPVGRPLEPRAHRPETTLRYLNELSRHGRPGFRGYVRERDSVVERGAVDLARRCARGRAEFGAAFRAPTGRPRMARAHGRSGPNAVAGSWSDTGQVTSRRIPLSGVATIKGGLGRDVRWPRCCWPCWSDAPRSWPTARRA